jgi:hypothetical protein
MTTRKRHSPEQVVRKLATADRILGEGRDVADVCRELLSWWPETRNAPCRRQVRIGYLDKQ